MLYNHFETILMSHCDEYLLVKALQSRMDIILKIGLFLGVYLAFIESFDLDHKKNTTPPIEPVILNKFPHDFIGYLFELICGTEDDNDQLSDDENAG